MASTLFPPLYDRRVIRIAFLLAVLCLAACGSSSSSSGGTEAPSSTAPTSSTGASAVSTTTRPKTTTTLSPKVADAFTQAALTSAMDAARSIYAQSYDYTTVTPASLAPLVPNVRVGPIESANSKVMGLLAQGKHDVLLAFRSPNGHWYCIVENATDGVSYGSGTSRDAVDSNGECQKPAWPAPGETPPPF
jgi:hypothetical protein